MSDAQIVIAVHDLRRNIARAVGSVVLKNHTRALVVCHNLPRVQVQEALAPVLAQSDAAHRVELIEHHDQTPSPSGPFNAGIAQAQATWVGIMGSDDELQTGAVSHWVAQGERHGGDAVVAKIIRAPHGQQPARLVRSPMPRLSRPVVLDAVKDRLYYRSAPLGLMRTQFLKELGLELLPGARSGGDLPFVAQLWSQGRIISGLTGPAYVEHADAPVRVTHDPKPVAVELMAVAHTLRHIWPTLQVQQRTALAVKLLRRNLMDTLFLRGGGAELTEQDQQAFGEILTQIRELSPQSLELIPRAHRQVFDHIINGQWPLVPAAFARIGSPFSPAMLLPAALGQVAHRQAPIRIAAGAAFMR